MRAFLILLLAAGLGVAGGAALAVWQYGSPYGGAAFDPRLTAGQRAASELPADGRRPRVEVDAEVYDCGEVTAGGKADHGFVFHNRGDYPLRLSHNPERDTSCSCALGNVRDNVVPPGGKTVVTMTMNLEEAPGPVRQTATVHTNDPERPNVALTITGQRVTPVSVSRGELTFSSLGQDETRSGSFHVISMKSESLDVSLELTNEKIAEFFELSSRPLPPEEFLEKDAKAETLVTAQVKPGLALGPFEQTILVRVPEDGVSDDDEPRRVVLRGRVVSDIELIGRGWRRDEEILDLGSVAAARGMKAPLLALVRGPHAADVQLTLAETEPAGALRVEVGAPAPLDDGRLVRIPLTVKVPPNAPSVTRMGPQQGGYGTILLKTTHPELKELRIRVRFAVAA